MSSQSRTVKVSTCQSTFKNDERNRTTTNGGGHPGFQPRPKPQNSLLQGVSRLFPRAPAKPAWIDGRRPKFNAPVEDPIGSNPQRLATKQTTKMTSAHHGTQFPRPKDTPLLSTCLIGVNGGDGNRRSFGVQAVQKTATTDPSFEVFKEGMRAASETSEGENLVLLIGWFGG